MVIPQPGETWRHCLGATVTIKLLDFISTEVQEGHTLYFGATYNAIAACQIPADSAIVIYTQNDKCRARSLANFTEVLGSAKDKASGTMYYRYQKICSP